VRVSRVDEHTLHGNVIGGRGERVVHSPRGAAGLGHRMRRSKQKSAGRGLNAGGASHCSGAGAPRRDERRRRSSALERMCCTAGLYELATSLGLAPSAAATHELRLRRRLSHGKMMHVSLVVSSTCTRYFVSYHSTSTRHGAFPLVFGDLQGGNVLFDEQTPCPAHGANGSTLEVRHPRWMQRGIPSGFASKTRGVRTVVLDAAARNAAYRDLVASGAPASSGRPSITQRCAQPIASKI
jgi:hypothetical protein